MTVSAPAKLEALERAFRSPGASVGRTTPATSMCSASGTPPEAMAPDFSGVRRAVEVYHGKIAKADASVLTAGVDAAGIKS